MGRSRAIIPITAIVRATELIIVIFVTGVEAILPSLLTHMCMYEAGTTCTVHRFLDAQRPKKLLFESACVYS